MYKRENHPEFRVGEMFLGNFTERNFREHIGWWTKRMGNIAYDVNDWPTEPVEGLYPVFVQRVELKKKGIDI